MKVKQANRGGVMLPMKGTEPGKPGWYQVGMKVYHFEVTDGEEEWSVRDGPITLQ
jgi:hypothetical protein